MFEVETEPDMIQKKVEMAAQHSIIGTRAGHILIETMSLLALLKG